MFKPVSSRLNLTLLEEEMLRHWKSHRIFEKSAARRQGAPEYVFYEGPPTANGKPGVHHGLARAFKDVFPRYPDAGIQKLLGVPGQGACRVAGTRVVPRD